MGLRALGKCGSFAWQAEATEAVVRTAYEVRLPGFELWLPLSSCVTLGKALSSSVAPPPQGNVALLQILWNEVVLARGLERCLTEQTLRAGAPDEACR